MKLTQLLEFGTANPLVSFVSYAEQARKTLETFKRVLDASENQIVPTEPLKTDVRKGAAFAAKKVEAAMKELDSAIEELKRRSRTTF